LILTWYIPTPAKQVCWAGLQQPYSTFLRCIPRTVSRLRVGPYSAEDWPRSPGNGLLDLPAISPSRFRGPNADWRSCHVTRNARRGVIYNGVDEPALRAVPESEPPVIAMVARFDYPKQQELLIRAFARVVGNARLWLIGDGPGLEAARRLAQHSAVRDKIIFWGDRSDVPQPLAQSQIGALVSAREGFGLSLVEAMSVGLPVIASACGGTCEIVRHGYTGLLVLPGNEMKLTLALDRLVADPVRRRQMGDAGLERYRANFTAHAMVERTFQVYESLLGSLPETQGLECSARTCHGNCGEAAFSEIEGANAQA
jgi:glycosyltransferase involved in cell wall biosynthesis